MTEGPSGDHTCLGEATADGVVSSPRAGTGSRVPISSGVLCLQRHGVYPPIEFRTRRRRKQQHGRGRLHSTNMTALRG
jgi:hypothetical protein